MKLFNWLKPAIPVLRVKVACPHGSPEPITRSDDLGIGETQEINCPLCNYTVSVTYVGDTR